jgi:hypothetical protein
VPQLITTHWAWAIAVLAIVGCSDQQTNHGCPASGVRVYVTRDGTIHLNGATVVVENFQNTLASITPPPTVVCYSRDTAAAEPHAHAVRVVDAIIALRLPVSFYTDESFATVVPME